nr:hypothetical protein [Tanacetum cinerariifolium]
MEEEMTLEIGPSFPPEIFREILLKATAKSLLRCNNSLELVNPLQQPQPDEVRILGSCNGLLCIVEEWKGTLFIYDPTTRRSNLLPSPQLTGSSGLFYGFGYDELSNDYKVVITETESKMATRIYSLNSGRKSVISLGLVRLMMENETYGEVLQPMYHEGYDYLELGVSGEWLCVLCDYAGYCVVTVLVMKVYAVKDSWTHLAHIPYPPTWTVQVRAPFCISEDGKLMLKFGQNLVVYDSKDNSSSVIDNFIVCLEACTVVESLVSPFSPLGLAGYNDDED